MIYFYFYFDRHLISRYYPLKELGTDDRLWVAGVKAVWDDDVLCWGRKRDSGQIAKRHTIEERRLLMGVALKLNAWMDRCG